MPIGFISVSLPIYLKRLGFDEILAGTFFTVSGITSVALVIPLGILADRYGRRRIVLLGCCTFVLAVALLVLAESYIAFVAAAATLGLAEALMYSTFDALLADATTPAQRTAAFGFTFFLSTLAFAAGNLVATLPDAAYLRDPLNVPGAYRPPLTDMVVVAALAPILISAVRLPAVRVLRGKSLLPRKSAPILTKFFASNFVMGMGAGLIIPLFSLWFLLKFSLGEGVTGPLIAVANVVVGVAYLAAPLLERRYGMVRSIVSLQFLATGVLFLIPFTWNLYAVGTLYVVRNLLMNVSWPMASSFLMSTVDESERSAASAVVGASFQLPFAMSTAVGGYLLTVHVDLPFFVTTALYLTGITTFWFFFRNLRKPSATAGRSL